MRQGSTPSLTIQELKDRLRSVHWAEEAPAVSTGSEALDELFSGRGLRRGTFVEWLADSEGQGAETLSLIVAGGVVGSRGGSLVVLDEQGTFYAPVAAALGIDLKSLVVLRPTTAADSLWALEQTLRCPGVGAVICRLGDLSDRGLQRLKRAAEAGGSVGLFLRPATVRGLSSWAETRLGVQSVACQSPGWRLRVEVLRCRKGDCGHVVEVEIDHETGCLCPVPRVASPAAKGRQARA